MPDKNTGSFLAFSPTWFKKHQRILLWLCNAPVLKYWFRYVLRIHKYDCPIDTKITELGPNRFSYGDRLILDMKDGKLKRERTTDFRTHPKFSKRIYFAFKPLWWTLHAWDWLVADRFVPAWSFGFATLTAYPGMVSADNPIGGFIQFTEGASWEAAHDAASGTSVKIPSTPYSYLYISAGYYTTTPKFTIERTVTCFDTSELPDEADITAAVISIFGRGNATQNESTTAINVVSANPASTSTLAVGDYSCLGTTVYATKNIADIVYTNGATNDWTLDATGRGTISKTGISKFGFRVALDVTNTAPSADGNHRNQFNGWNANAEGTTSDPKLVVTYTAIVDLDISVYDSVAVAEVVTRDLQLNPSVFDAVSVTENLSTDNQLNPFVYDAVAVAEDIVGQMDLGGISVFDTVAIAEVIAAQIDLGDISVYDEVTITESITTETIFSISVYDSIEVIDSANSQIDLGDISVYDEVTITESNEFFFDLLLLSVYDEVTITEDTSAQIDLGDILVSDTVTITESITAQIPDLGDILVYDDISVSENIAMEGFLNIDVNDAVSITESVTLLVTARRDGWIVNLRSDQQKYPLSMDQNDTRKMRSFEQDSPKSMDTTDIL